MSKLLIHIDRGRSFIITSMSQSIDRINPNPIHDLIIIGGGCAGLSAAIYAARGELCPLLFAGQPDSKGGMLVKTSVVENYPGFPEGIEGFNLVDNMEKQAKKYGTTIIDHDIVSVDLSSKPFTLTADDSKIYKTKTLIIATGSKPNKLGLDNENLLWGRGISSCAVCDGALFRNKRIVVVGGGDSAMEEALFLTKFSDVTLIHRKSSFRASKVMQKRVLANPKIHILYETTIERLTASLTASLTGTSRLVSIDVKNHKTDEIVTLPVDGLFYGLGLHPNTDIFKGQLDMDSEGCINMQVPGTAAPHKYTTMTSVPGVFVAGDAQVGAYRQAVVAAGDGCKAALDANNYLNHFEMGKN